MHYHGSLDRTIRRLERELSQTCDSATAIALYHARKRGGDLLAGSKWYDWLVHLYLIHSDDMADPSDYVWLVEDDIYCDDCGEGQAGNAAIGDDIPPPYYRYDAFGFDLTEPWLDGVIERYRHKNLLTLLRGLSNMEYPMRVLDPNREILCEQCDTVLKLSNYTVEPLIRGNFIGSVLDIPWREALA